MHITGYSESTNFPTVDALDTSHNGNRDVVIAKLNAVGSSLLFSSYFGAASAEEGQGIALDSTGGVYVTGYTDSSGFPTTSGAFDTSYDNNGDAFVLKINGLQVGNQPPTANNQTVATNEDTDVTITLTGDDGDPLATQNLTFKISSLPTNGVLYQRAAGDTRGPAITTAGTTVTDSLGRVIFAPDANENGSPYSTFQFTVTDDGTPSLTSAPAIVTVNVAAVGDAPVIGAGNDTGAVAEDGTLVASATLTSSDVDTDDTPTWSAAAASYGAAAIDSATGQWTYTLDNSHAAVQGLGEGDTLTDSFLVTVTDEDGLSDTRTVTITITGDGDAPVIGAGNDTGAVAEDGTLLASATLTSSDVDTDDTPTWSAAAASYGAAAIDSATGQWTYTLDNSHAAVQGLGEGDTLTDSFLVTVTDEDGLSDTRTVTITITGDGDAPVIGAGNDTARWQRTARCWPAPPSPPATWIPMTRRPGRPPRPATARPRSTRPRASGRTRSITAMPPCRVWAKGTRSPTASWSRSPTKTDSAIPAP